MIVDVAAEANAIAVGESDGVFTLTPTNREYPELPRLCAAK